MYGDGDPTLDHLSNGITFLFRYITREVNTQPEVAVAWDSTIREGYRAIANLVIIDPAHQ